MSKQDLTLLGKLSQNQTGLIRKGKMTIKWIYSQGQFIVEFWITKWLPKKFRYKEILVQAKCMLDFDFLNIFQGASKLWL